jgi:uncharacterized protein YodC (DUF2158 family)
MGDIKIGDVVMLKSGGPKMTVEYIPDGSIIVKCVWFVGTELQRGEFKMVLLDRVSR